MSRQTTATEIRATLVLTGAYVAATDTFVALIKEQGDTVHPGTARLLAARGGDPIGALY